ncbi:MAG: pyruvate kinase, partial [Spirochaetaceae bacterium]|nr:pyruvate kinase [Spirochaetaceae bacterium]
MFERKTKIVCSLGPATADDAVLRDLILGGMNVARLNFSHGDHESHGKTAERVRRISGELGIPVALLLDTKGPEIRTGMTEGDQKVTISRGDRVTVTVDGCLTRESAGGKPARMSISWTEGPEKLKGGHKILVADGLLELDVLGTEAGAVLCRAA